ncbi:hypothetical protein NQ317_016680, partial [Molorchus minor]
NGYNLKLNKIKNCADDSVVKILPGFTVTLDNDCNLIFNGCVDITKPLKTAKGSYHLKKPPLPPLDGDIDYCETMGEYDIKAIRDIFKTLGLPTKCPYSAKKVCLPPNTKLSIAQYKNQLGLASGTSEAKLEAVHDTGHTCVEFGATISKARKG